MATTLARRVLVALGIWVGFLSSGAFAAVPVVGWGYSVGNAFWGIAPWSDEGAGWWDPPADSILQGRVTLRFDPAKVSPAQLISRLTARYPIRDLFVQNPPIEEIIARLYGEHEG